MLKSTVVSSLFAAGLAAASPAFAWQNSGSYTGPNGGTARWTYGCGPYAHFCGRGWSATTPGGQTYTGGATVRHPWYGWHVANRWASGPNGSYYVRRRW